MRPSAKGVFFAVAVVSCLAVAGCHRKTPAPAMAPPPPPPPPRMAAPRPMEPVIAITGVPAGPIGRGESVTLEWTATNAGMLTLEPGGQRLAASGSLILRPAKTTEYALTAEGPGGKARLEFTIEVREPESAPPPPPPPLPQPRPAFPPEPEEPPVGELLSAFDRGARIAIPAQSLLPAVPGGARASALDRIIEALPTAGFTLELPPLQVGTRIRSRLLLDPLAVKLAAGQGVPAGFRRGRQTRIASTMEAELVADDGGMSISALGEARRDVSFRSPTEWFWDVEARSEAPARFTLTLRAVLPVAGQERAVPMPGFPVFGTARVQAPSPSRTAAPQPLAAQGAVGPSREVSRQRPGDGEPGRPSGAAWPWYALVATAILSGAVWLARSAWARKARPAAVPTLAAATPTATPAVMAPRCFLSYSRKDEAFAHRLLHDLQARGIDVWIDTESRTLGDWEESVARHIETSTHVLFLFSSHSWQSQRVRDEIAWAREKNRIVVPILIEAGIQLPFGVHRSNGIDFTHGYAAALNRLTASLRETAAGGAGSSGMAMPA